MASLLRDFEQQYASTTGEITILLNEIRHQSGAEKRSSIHEVERHFEECKELFEQMELEIRALPLEEKNKYLHRLQSYKAQVQTLQQDLKTARSQTAAEQRDELFAMDETSAAFDDQRQVLLENSERLDRTTFKLEQGYRVALETEQIGSGVLDNLGTQRESLNKSRQRLADMEHDLGTSSRILTNMIRRVIQNRVAITCIFAILLLIVGIVIYLSTRHNP